MGVGTCWGRARWGGGGRVDTVCRQGYWGTLHPPAPPCNCSLNPLQPSAPDQQQPSQLPSQLPRSRPATFAPSAACPTSASARQSRSRARRWRCPPSRWVVGPAWAVGLLAVVWCGRQLRALPTIAICWLGGGCGLRWWAGRVQWMDGCMVGGRAAAVVLLPVARHAHLGGTRTRARSAHAHDDGSCPHVHDPRSSCMHMMTAYHMQVEDPTVSMTFKVNTSPFAGKEGKFVTSRNVKDRLDRELERNLALRCAGTTSRACSLLAPGPPGRRRCRCRCRQPRRRGLSEQPIWFLCWVALRGLLKGGPVARYVSSRRGPLVPPGGAMAWLACLLLLLHILHWQARGCVCVDTRAARHAADLRT